MSARRTRRRLATALVLALALAAGGPGVADAAKKKKKGGSVFSKQVTVNAPIPDRGPGQSVAVPVVSTITVPKAFKGKVVKDLNVTNLQETGTAGALPLPQISASLTAPNGRTVTLHEGIGYTALGPLTIDDDTFISICFFVAPAVCADPTQGLYAPFAGTANMVHNVNGGFPPNGPLASFDGLKMKGTWTLTVSDGTNNQTSTLNQWGLRITGRPG